MGAGASASVAIKDSSEHELHEALAALPAKEKCKIQLGLAWAALTKKLDEKKFLVAEMEAMKKSPGRVLAAEEMLCKLCSLEAVPPDEPDWHLTAKLNLYRMPQEMSPEVAEARTKTFLQSLEAVKAKPEGDLAAALSEYVKNPDNAPSEVAKSSLLFQYVAEWLHALDAESPDSAWGELVKKLEEDKFLVHEVANMSNPPSKVASAEEVLCKLCSVAPVPPDEPNWHLTATLNLYKIPDELDEKVSKARTQTFLAGLDAVKADAECAAKLSEYVKNPENAPLQVAKSSLLFRYVAEWLHALHAYCVLL